MDQYKNTIVRMILSKTRIKTVITEIQNSYVSSELDVEYE